MKSVALVLALAMAIPFSPSARGQDRPPSASEVDESTVRFTLDAYLREVLQGNLELVARRAHVSIARAEIAIAKVFPDPQMTGGVLQYDVSGHGNPTATVVQLGLPIELGGKRSARVAVAEEGVSTAEAELEDFLRTLRADAANAYVSALVARLVSQRKHRTLESLEELVRVNEQRLRAGEIGELQLVQSRVEAEQFRAQVLASEGDVQTADLALIQQLGMGSSSRMQRSLLLEGNLEKAAGLTFDTQALVAHGLSHRPDLRSSERRVSLARKQIDLAKANRTIDLTVGATWQHNLAVSADPPLPHVDLLGATVTVPLPLSRMYRGELDAAYAAEQQSRALVQAARLAVEIDVRQAIARYEAAAPRVKLYTQGVLTNADKALGMTLYDYRRGGATLVEVLVAQRTVDEVYLSYYEALAQSAHALIAVQQAAAVWNVRF